jgi:UDP-glucose:(heptosyl)LPS alpha-1,3-glucosyltransferase
MDIAFCYEKVLPARGGCETYIADLARRLVADGHLVHMYACRWDAAALPSALRYHPLPVPPGPRFLKPWLFGAACASALCQSHHDVSVGFDKTWGQDVLYPQGGLHAANTEHNLDKYRNPLVRRLVRLLKIVDPVQLSFTRLERKQYLGPRPPLVVVNSHMVSRHFEHHLGYRRDDLRIVRSAIDSTRFPEHDRPCRRFEARLHWGLGSDHTVGLFAAMNYRLKGLEPLLHAVRLLPSESPFRLLVIGNPRITPYERMARRLGIAGRVHFAGYCAEMSRAYFAADFLVHPTFYDPCSLVVLEALSCGLPVITTRANGASELLSPPREGFVIPDPHDHHHLAWAINQLLDTTRRCACSQAARRTAAAWTFEQHYQQLLQVFTEVAARKRAA